MRTRSDQLIRRLANSMTAVKHDDWEIEHRSNRSPLLYNGDKPSELNASVAHSGRWVAVALTSGSRIGVDIQTQDERSRYREMAELLDMDDGASVDQRHFFSCWSLREAIAKATDSSVLTPHPIEPELARACREHGQIVSAGQFVALVDMMPPDAHLAVVLNNNKELST
jgi:phosphopantetheinyl transferase